MPHEAADGLDVCVSQQLEVEGRVCEAMAVGLNFIAAGWVPLASNR
jgi:hypothetical protein